MEYNLKRFDNLIANLTKYSTLGMLHLPEKIRLNVETIVQAALLNKSHFKSLSGWLANSIRVLVDLHEKE